MKQTNLQEKEYYLIPTELIHKIQSDLGSLASYIPNHFDDLALIAHQLGDNEIITSPIEFDAKKVAEEIYCDFLSITPNSNTYFLKRCCIKALNYSHYTLTQRELILKELNKV